jgi:hypothetical protein
MKNTWTPESCQQVDQYSCYYPDDEQPKKSGSSAPHPIQHGNVHVEGVALVISLQGGDQAKAKVCVDNLGIAEGPRSTWKGIAAQTATMMRRKAILKRQQKQEVHFGKFVRGKWKSGDGSHLGFYHQAAIAPAPTIATHKVEAEETKMVCKSSNGARERWKTRALDLLFKSRRNLLWMLTLSRSGDQGVPITMDYRFYVPNIGPVVKNLTVGTNAGLLESCTSSADVGDGSL